MGIYYDLLACAWENSDLVAANWLIGSLCFVGKMDTYGSELLPPGLQIFGKNVGHKPI